MLTSSNNVKYKLNSEISFWGFDVDNKDCTKVKLIQSHPVNNWVIGVDRNQFISLWDYSADAASCRKFHIHAPLLFAQCLLQHNRNISTGQRKSMIHSNQGNTIAGHIINRVQAHRQYPCMNEYRNRMERDNTASVCAVDGTVTSLMSAHACGEVLHVDFIPDHAFMQHPFLRVVEPPVAAHFTHSLPNYHVNSNQLVLVYEAGVVFYSYHSKSSQLVLNSELLAHSPFANKIFALTVEFACGFAFVGCSDGSIHVYRYALSARQWVYHSVLPTVNSNSQLLAKAVTSHNSVLRLKYMQFHSYDSEPQQQNNSTCNSMSAIQSGGGQCSLHALCAVAQDGTAVIWDISSLFVNDTCAQIPSRVATPQSTSTDAGTHPCDVIAKLYDPSISGQLIGQLDVMTHAMLKSGYSNSCRIEFQSTTKLLVINVNGENCSKQWDLNALCDKYNTRHVRSSTGAQESVKSDYHTHNNSSTGFSGFGSIKVERAPTELDLVSPFTQVKPKARRSSLAFISAAVGFSSNTPTLDQSVDSARVKRMVALPCVLVSKQSDQNSPVGVNTYVAKDCVSTLIPFALAHYNHDSCYAYTTLKGNSISIMVQHDSVAVDVNNNSQSNDAGKTHHPHRTEDNISAGSYSTNNTIVTNRGNVRTLYTESVLNLSKLLTNYLKQHPATMAEDVNAVLLSAIKESAIRIYELHITAQQLLVVASNVGVIVIKCSHMSSLQRDHTIGSHPLWKPSYLLMCSPHIPQVKCDVSLHSVDCSWEEGYYYSGKEWCRLMDRCSLLYDAAKKISVPAALPDKHNACSIVSCRPQFIVSPSGRFCVVYWPNNYYYLVLSTRYLMRANKSTELPSGSIVPVDKGEACCVAWVTGNRVSSMVEIVNQNTVVTTNQNPPHASSSTAPVIPALAAAAGGEFDYLMVYTPAKRNEPTNTGGGGLFGSRTTTEKATISPSYAKVKVYSATGVDVVSSTETSIVKGLPEHIIDCASGVLACVTYKSVSATVAASTQKSLSQVEIDAQKKTTGGTSSAPVVAATNILSQFYLLCHANTITVTTTHVTTVIVPANADTTLSVKAPAPLSMHAATPSTGMHAATPSTGVSSPPPAEAAEDDEKAADNDDVVSVISKSSNMSIRSTVAPPATPPPASSTPGVVAPSTSTTVTNVTSAQFVPVGPSFPRVASLSWCLQTGLLAVVIDDTVHIYELQRSSPEDYDGNKPVVTTTTSTTTNTVVVAAPAKVMPVGFKLPDGITRAGGTSTTTTCVSTKTTHSQSSSSPLQYSLQLLSRTNMSSNAALHCTTSVLAPLFNIAQLMWLSGGNVLVSSTNYHTNTVCVLSTMYPHHHALSSSTCRKETDAVKHLQPVDVTLLLQPSAVCDSSNNSVVSQLLSQYAVSGVIELCACIGHSTVVFRTRYGKMCYYSLLQQAHAPLVLMEDDPAPLLTLPSPLYPSHHILVMVQLLLGSMTPQNKSQVLRAMMRWFVVCNSQQPGCDQLTATQCAILRMILNRRLGGELLTVLSDVTLDDDCVPGRLARDYYESMLYQYISLNTHWDSTPNAEDKPEYVVSSTISKQKSVQGAVMSYDSVTRKLDVCDRRLKLLGIELKQV